MRAIKKKPGMIANRSSKDIKTVRQLKKKYNEVPLGFLFGIPDELDFQCPNKDEYMDKIIECQTALNKAKRARTLESKDGHILKALFAIKDLDTTLDNNVRTNFIDLRSFAKEWKRLAIKLLNASKNPEKYILTKWNLSLIHI